jgi:Xaa-Pro aminopeptidase
MSRILVSILFALFVVTAAPLPEAMTTLAHDAVAASAAEPIPAPLPASVFKARRARLMKTLGPGVAVLYSKGSETPEGYRSSPDFFYLTGIDEEGAALVLAPGERTYKEVLHLRSVDPELDRWTGMRGLIGDSLRTALGFERIRRASSLESSLVPMLAHSPVLHAIAAAQVSASKSPEAELYSKLQSSIPGLSVRNHQGEIAAMRQVKDADELRLLEKAMANSISAMRVAAREIRPGVEENWIAGLIDLEFKRGGSTRAGFPSIVGSGINSCVLHYPQHDRTIPRGSMVVVDIGAEYDHYSADLTRTFPADGHFTPEQRRIYQLVLKVQDECIAMVKPGVVFEDIQRRAEDLFRAAGYRNNALHGIGHWVGLDVHDAGDYARPLEPGMIVMIEPGLYFPEHELGIRLEDELLVTRNGNRVLSGSLPRDPDAIERMMSAP